jgi:alginate O-acetyltransferase complex protein AlgI
LNYNNPTFWLLFLAVYASYWRLRHRRQNDLLLVASYVFYGFWDYRFLFLILISTVIDFIGGLGVAGIELPRHRRLRLFALLVGSGLILCTHVQYAPLREGLRHADGAAVLAALPQHLKDFWVPLATAAICLAYSAVLPRLYALPATARRKTFLTISMVANLAILGFFKYCDFFIGSFVDLLHAFGVQNPDVRMLGILLPPGISFYTFQAMSYTVDVYRDEAAPTDNLRDFALFVCFFPHLVAGPIMRASTLLPQVVQPRQRKPGAVEEGAVLVLLGLFKKIVIADNLAPLVNMIFFQYDAGSHTTPTGFESLLGLYGFMFQVYGDFSGYSSVARGISKWLGFELVINFQTPYLSTTPSEHWRRWHISLSTWFRDYLYIPIGGNRGGLWMEYRNVIITMTLAGLWHGAAWTYVIWGAYTGVLLCVSRTLGVREVKNVPGHRFRWAFRVLVTFHLTCSSYLFFRSSSVPGALRMGWQILTDFTPTAMAATMAGLLLFYTLPLFLLEAYTEGERNLGRLFASPWPRQAFAYSYFVLMLVLFPAVQAHDFIYFQF